jgi:type I restriction enzyme S subunit
MSFPRYPEYKDSGVAWLGEVPGHWGVLQLKRIASLKSGESITADSIEETGDFPVFGGNGLRGFTGRFTHEGHYALIGRQGALCGNVNYASGRFWASEHAVVVTPLEEVATRWLGEVLRAMNLNQYSVSAAQPGLSVESVSTLSIPFPAITEQERIAAFLDRETAKIDALVEEQQRLIELLKEKRQVVISQAVTKGLNPNVPMKDSGVEWLGNVPAHWDVLKLKRISLSQTVGIVVNPSSYVSDDGLPFLYGGDVSEGRINVDDCRRISIEDSDKNAKTKLQEGDLLTVRVGAPGVTAVVPRAAQGGNCASVMLIRRGDFDSNWLCYAMNDRVVRFQVEIVQYGAAQEQFNIGHAVDFVVPTPPANEQKELAEFLGRETEEIDALIGEAGQAVELLQERRAALISAAVTGKIDVREAA